MTNKSPILTIYWILQSTLLSAILLSPLSALAVLPADCDSTIGGAIISPSEVQSAISNVKDANRDYKLKICLKAGTIVQDNSNSWSISNFKRDLWIAGDPSSPAIFNSYKYSNSNGTTPGPLNPNQNNPVFRLSSQFGIRFSDLAIRLNTSGDRAWDAYASYIWSIERCSVSATTTNTQAINLSSAQIDLIQSATFNVSAPATTLEPSAPPIQSWQINPVIGSYLGQIREIKNLTISADKGTAIDLSSSSIGKMLDFVAQTNEGPILHAYLSNIGTLKRASLTQRISPYSYSSDGPMNIYNSTIGILDRVTLTRPLIKPLDLPPGSQWPPYSVYYPSLSFNNTWVGSMRKFVILTPDMPSASSAVYFSGGRIGLYSRNTNLLNGKAIVPSLSGGAAIEEYNYN